MSQQVNNATLALQFEKVRDRVSIMYQLDDTLFGKIKKTELEVVSSRPTRIPMELLAGGNFQQSNPDGGDFGVGSGITLDFGTITPVYFSQAVQYSKLAEISTDSNEKAIESIASLNLKRAMDQFNTNIEALLQGDGSGTLDTVVSATSGASSTIVVSNPNQFYDGQTIQVFPSVGGTSRGSVTITSVDVAAKTLNFGTTLPSTGGATAAGDILVVAGSTGAAASSLLGIKYFQLDSNVGTVLGLNRATYPGKLRTPHVACGNQSLTQAFARQALQKMRSALGADTPFQQELIWHMGLDMEAAWEDVGLVVSQVIQNQVTGNSSVDMLKHDAPKTMAGRPVVASIHATPGRIDGICLKNWGRVENKPIDFLEFGGQTLFPTYGGSGGLNASTIFYLWTGMNIYNANVRAGTFIDGVAIPAGY
jgi:hypothetical protein